MIDKAHAAAAGPSRWIVPFRQRLLSSLSRASDHLLTQQPHIPDGAFRDQPFRDLNCGEVSIGRAIKEAPVMRRAGVHHAPGGIEAQRQRLLAKNMDPGARAVDHDGLVRSGGGENAGDVGAIG